MRFSALLEKLKRAAPSAPSADTDIEDNPAILRGRIRRLLEENEGLRQLVRTARHQSKIFVTLSDFKTHKFYLPAGKLAILWLGVMHEPAKTRRLFASTVAGQSSFGAGPS